MDHFTPNIVWSLAVSPPSHTLTHTLQIFFWFTNPTLNNIIQGWVSFSKKNLPLLRSGLVYFDFPFGIGREEWDSTALWLSTRPIDEEDSINGGVPVV